MVELLIHYNLVLRASSRIVILLSRLPNYSDLDDSSSEYGSMGNPTRLSSFLTPGAF